MRALTLAVVGVMIWQLTNDRGLRAQAAQADAREFAAGRTRPAASPAAAEPARWPRLFLSDPIVRTHLRLALAEASALLSQSQCQAILGEFCDGDGRPVAERLARLGVTAPDYLRWIVFVDANNTDRCANGSLALTSPGSRVVHVCATEFKRSYRDNPDHAVASLIHEALHTLGLGENPPASEDITRRVQMRCRRDHD